MATDALNRQAFEGPAGCGKTHNLIEALEKCLVASPILPGQRILALTYMNGARRRLDARLSLPSALKGRCDVQTIDSFARSVLHARRSVARSLGLVLTRLDYTADCGAAARLLEQPGIAAWVANTYPIIVIDEFQDADPARLAIIRALGSACQLFLAADEFQCLSAQLLPSEAVAWMRSACLLTPLQQNHRTNSPQLLHAAKLLRDGDNLAPGRPLTIIVPPGPNAIAWSIASQLDRNAADTKAIITPSATPQFSKVLDRIEGKVGKTHKFAPRHVRRETNSADELQFLKQLVAIDDRRNIPACIDALTATNDPHLIRLAKWLQRKQQVAPLPELSEQIVEERLSLILHQSRHYGPATERGLAAMTVYAAKNREFDGVVVFWPYQIGGSDDHKRRLLYNAVTRAKKWCSIVVQGDQLLNTPPFKR